MTTILLSEFAGLLGRVCPAAVYEYVDADAGDAEAAEGKKLVINSQNCSACRPCVQFLSLDADCFAVHCKTCSIKVRLSSRLYFALSPADAHLASLFQTPTQDITWTVPEGGGGPKYALT